MSDGWLRMCRSCWSGLAPWSGPACARCGLPFVSRRALDAVAPECADCRRDVPGFDASRSFGLYRGNLRRSIVRLKFGGDERLGVRMGELMALPLALLSHGDDRGEQMIVPVPLHPSRRRERGYNQSELLALGLARKLNSIAPAEPPRVLRDGLCRERATPPQAGLTVAARRENVRGVFEVVNPERIRGRRIILVDDVMTTGATVAACARALKRAGAAHVTAITLARATPQFPDLGSDDRDNTVDGLGRDWT
jgi:ComF family protein